MGIGLLAVVVSLGVTSALNASQTLASSNAGGVLSPFAIQHFPWALLPGFLVPTAFFAHVGSIRLLAARTMVAPYRTTREQSLPSESNHSHDH
jgi:hypothetical protein